VTVLTSLGRADLAAVGLAGEVEAAVERLARLALSSGLGGLVSSAREAAFLRGVVGDSMALVTPGIRPSGGEVGDQKRIVTPADAVRAGADYLVVGRPVTAAPDPAAAARSILAEMGEAGGARG
jgi:orotidine-5'-phosphate decarboxylase